MLVLNEETFRSSAPQQLWLSCPLWASLMRKLRAEIDLRRLPPRTPLMLMLMLLKMKRKGFSFRVVVLAVAFAVLRNSEIGVCFGVIAVRRIDRLLQPQHNFGETRRLRSNTHVSFQIPTQLRHALADV